MKQEVYIEKTYGREKKGNTEFNGVIKGVVVTALALSVFLGVMTPKAYASSFMDKFSQEPNTIEALYMTEDSIITNLTKTIGLLEELKEKDMLTDQDLVNLAVCLGQLNTIAKDTEHTDEVLKLLDRAENLVKGKYGAGVSLVLDAVNEARGHFDFDTVNVKDYKSGLVIYQFSDVGSNDWFYNNITELVKLGAINGYQDGTFKPNNNISYAEYLKILACSLGAESKAYTKQEGDEWYSPYIAACYENGIIGTYEDIDFNAPITRSDAARFTEKALNNIKNEETKNTDGFGSKITDYKTFKGTADEYYILQQYAKGILVGDQNGAFRPTSNLTRAEASTIILRAVKPEIRQVISTSSPSTSHIENELVITEGPYVGRMRTAKATEYDLQALRSVRFYKDNGKLIISIDLPDLPSGFKWSWFVAAYDAEGSYVFSTTKSMTYGAVGNQKITVESEFDEVSTSDIRTTTIEVRIVNNNGQSMVSHKLSTDAKGQILRQSSVDSSDAEWLDFDTSEIFKW